MEKCFYVYSLADPRDGRAFYVGKGKGGRIKQHVANVRNGRFDNGAKCERIAAILQAGLKVVETVHQSGLTEQEAFALEKRMIEETPGLTNIVSGCVSAAQSASAKAATFYRSLKSYPEWLLTTDAEKLRQAEAVFGDPATFYERFKAELRSLIAPDDLNFIRGKSNAARG